MKLDGVFETCPTRATSRRVIISPRYRLETKIDDRKDLLILINRIIEIAPIFPPCQSGLDAGISFRKLKYIFESLYFLFFVAKKNGLQSPVVSRVVWLRKGCKFLIPTFKKRYRPSSYIHVIDLCSLVTRSCFDFFDSLHNFRNHDAQDHTSRIIRQG